MRLLHCINTLTLGGAERLLLSLTVEQQRNAEVVVFTLGGTSRLDEKFRVAGIAVVNGTDRVGAVIGFTTAVRFIRLLRSFKPHIVHSHLPQSDLLSVLLKPRATVHFSTLHTSGQTSQNSITSKVARWAFAKVSSRSAGVIATSNSARDFALQLKLKCPVDVVLNGSDLVPDAPAVLSGKKAVCLARLHPVKGIDVLLDAFTAFAEKRSGWSLELYGQGMSLDNPDIVELVAGGNSGKLVADGRIIFCGETSDVMTVLCGADLLVSSSKGLETMPLVWVEASLAGVPIVTTRVGEWQSVVDRKDLSAEPGDRSSLERALLYYSDLDIDERIRIGADARATALREWSIKNVTAAYSTLYLRGLSRTERQLGV